MLKKIFRSIEEQIEILESKGLVINDYDKVSNILLRENYFFISGYRHLFMKNYKDNSFINGTTFEELYAVFTFDRKIRNIMFGYILIVENNMKSIISYQLSKKYGYKEKDYLNPNNFTQDSLKVRQVHDVLNKMKRQIRVNGQQHSATMHYLSNYGYIPMWILVKVLSLGILSELYAILILEDAEMIASEYELDVETLGTYLSVLANFRNLCAHDDILYDHRTQKEIPSNKYHQRLNIPMTDGHYDYGKNDLFALIIILKSLLTDDEFREMIYAVGYEMDVLAGKVKTVPLSKILNKVGFPDNWKDIVDL